MLAKARKNAAVAGVESQVRFEMGDGCRLPFPDHHFDLAMCNSLLHHVADPLATLNELARVTRPQGALLVKRSKTAFGVCVSVSRHLVWEALSGLDEAALYRFGASRVYAAGTRGFASEIEDCGWECISQRSIPHRDRTQELLDSESALPLCLLFLLLLCFRFRFEFRFLFFSQLNFLAADLFALPFAMNSRVKALGKFKRPNLLANDPVRRLRGKRLFPG